MNTKLIEEVCQSYGIGHCIAEPQSCVGGLLHQIYQFETTNGKFIVKILNPTIIDSVECKNRYRITENIAHELAKYIPAVCALTHQDDPLFTFDNATIMVFPYLNGRMLAQNEVTSSHTEKIAVSLAKIHQAEIVNVHAPAVELPVINLLNSKISISNSDLAEQFTTCLPAIDEIDAYCHQFESLLKNNLIISHRDLDPKNVLWDNERHHIIDWESAGLINKTKDVLATAIYWSLDDKFNVDRERFSTFLTTYQRVGESLPRKEIAAGLYGLLGDWISWLNFNLSRILNNPEQSAEFILGIKESRNTLNAIPILLTQVPKLIVIA